MPIKERCITFTKAMVQAERAGRKTETRRLTGLKKVNEQPDEWLFSRFRFNAQGLEAVFTSLVADSKDVVIVPCPYGKSGDRLYVKESLWIDNNYCPGLNWGTTVRVYAADERSSYEEHFVKSDASQLVTGRFMYKEMARTWLEVVEIRVERLRDITKQGALAEGIPYYDDEVLGRRYKDYSQSSRGYGHPDHDYPTTAFAQTSYLTLFASINKKAPPNPWVWAVKFKRLEHGTKAS